MTEAKEEKVKLYKKEDVESIVAMERKKAKQEALEELTEALLKKKKTYEHKGMLLTQVIDYVTVGDIRKTFSQKYREAEK